MTALARLLERVHTWLDPFASARAPATGEWLARVAEPVPGERVRGRHYLRLAKFLPKPRVRRLP